MIYARRQHQQIALLAPDPHPPTVSLFSHIEVSRSAKDIPYLFVLVHVLVEERLYLIFVDGAHRLRGDGDFIAMGVTALSREGVDAVRRGRVAGGKMRRQDTEGGEVREGEVGLGGMRKPGVTLKDRERESLAAF